MKLRQMLLEFVICWPPDTVELKWMLVQPVQADVGTAESRQVLTDADTAELRQMFVELRQMLIQLSYDRCCCN